MSAFSVDLQEILISDLQEGIFYSKLVCFTESDTVEIDSRTSDAIALAVRFGCPIFTYEHILENAGILMEEQETDKKKNIEAVGIQKAEVLAANDLSTLSMDELQKMLDNVLETEDYIKAIAIRDEIQKRK